MRLKKESLIRIVRRWKIYALQAIRHYAQGAFSAALLFSRPAREWSGAKTD
jgi:hypothetical protein